LIFDAAVQGEVAIAKSQMVGRSRWALPKFDVCIAKINLGEGW